MTFQCNNWRAKHLTYKGDGYSVRLRKMDVGEVLAEAPYLLTQLRGVEEVDTDDEEQFLAWVTKNPGRIKLGLRFQAECLVVAIERIDGFVEPGPDGEPVPLAWHDLDDDEQLELVKHWRAIDPVFFNGLWSLFKNEHTPHVDDLSE